MKYLAGFLMILGGLAEIVASFAHGETMISIQLSAIYCTLAAIGVFVAEKKE